MARALLLLLLLSTALPESMAQEQRDTTAVTRKRSLVGRFLDYFGDANKEKKHKRFDFFVRHLMGVNPPKWSDLKKTE